MSQGVNYIAGKMAASVGGIAAFCQLIALIFPAVVALVYLCVIRKVRFSFLLASNLVALMTLPSIAAAVLCMLGSLISPYVGLVPVFVGVIASDVLLCTLVARITGIPEQQSAPVKIALVCIAELLKIVFMPLLQSIIPLPQFQELVNQSALAHIFENGSLVISIMNRKI